MFCILLKTDRRDLWRSKRNLTILVARVRLGRVVESTERPPDSEAYDTLICGQDKRYLKYIVSDAGQIEPAYLVTYDRVYIPRGVEDGMVESIPSTRSSVAQQLLAMLDQEQDKENN